MKLVNSSTGFVVVEFNRGQTTFHDRFLEAQMREDGILIPKALTDQYGGKEVIFLEDPLFEKAFIEIYYPLSIANPLYKWEQS